MGGVLYSNDWASLQRDMFFNRLKLKLHELLPVLLNAMFL